MAADGSIVIDTRIDTSGIAAGTEELKQAFKRVTSSLSEMKKTGEYATRQTAKAFVELNKQAAEFEAQGIPTQKYRKLQAQVEAIQERLKGLISAQDNFLAADGSSDSEYFKDLQKDIAQVSSALEQAQIELKRLIMDGKAFTLGTGQRKEQNGTTAGFSQAEAGIQGTNNRLMESFLRLSAVVNAYRQSLVEASTYTGVLNSTIGGLGVVLRLPIAGFRVLGSVLKEVPLNVVETGIKGIRNILAELSVILRKVAKEAKKAALMLVQMVGKGMLGGLKKLSSGIFGLTKNTKKARGGLKGMLSSSLLLSSAFMAFYSVVNSVKEGINSLAQYSDGTNATLSSLKSSLTQLRNSLATAFSPIITAVAPALNSLIGMLNSAATAMARLMAMLAGQNSFVKAVKVQQNYADGLKDTGNAAKEAGKEAKKMIAPFDDLVQIERQSENSNGSGGSGGGEISPEDMFETVSVDPLNFDSWGEAFDSFLTYLLDTGIPTLQNRLSDLAEWINAFSTNLYETFTFPGVREKVQQLGKDLGKTFNGFAREIDWRKLGNALGAGLDLAIQFLTSLIYSFNWIEFGGALSEAMNGTIETIDWYSFGQLLWAKFKISLETLAGFLANLDMPELGKSASDIFKGFFDSITETLNNIDWQRIGNQIATFFASIDYSGISSSLFSGLGTALASLAEFLWGLIEQAWNSVVTWWQANAYEDGKFTIKGLLNGILDALAGIGTWIRKNIFDPFINGFKNAFGINSPSTVMIELGNNLIEGLIVGIQDLILSVILKFSQIKTQILQKWDEIKEGTTEKWNLIKSSLLTVWDTIKLNANTKFEELQESVSSIWETTKENTSTKWSEIQSSLNTTWDALKETSGIAFEALKNEVVKVWEGLRDKTSFLWGDEGISGIIKGCVNGIISSVEGMVNSVIDAINWLIENINEISIDVPDTPFSDGFTIGFDIPTLDQIRLPRLAAGTVIPPRAGEFAAILGDNNQEAEVVSPISAIKQAFLEAIEETNGAGNQTITLRFDGSLAALARVLKPELDRENARRGTNLVVVGGR